MPHASERVRKREALRRAQQRRRTILGGLVLIALATGTAAAFRGGTWLELHLIADGILVFYIALLLETKKRQDERATKVHRIPQHQEQDVVVFDTVRAGGHS